MSKRVNPLSVVRSVLYQAEHNTEARHKPVAGAGLDPRLAALREWQGTRIAHTYSDFAAQSEYAPALEFFLTDLYAARDFSQRDYDAERAYSFLQRIVPAEMLTLVRDSRELIHLTYALDAALLDVLVNELGMKKSLTAELYAEAYRRCDNAPLRAKQIELLVRVLHDAAGAARFPLAGPALRMARRPAHRAGWHELYGFLERGHAAFSKVKRPARLLDAVQTRETKIMRRILANEPNPLEI